MQSADCQQLFAKLSKIIVKPCASLLRKGRTHRSAPAYGLNEHILHQHHVKHRADADGQQVIMLPDVQQRRDGDAQPVSYTHLMRLRRSLSLHWRCSCSASERVSGRARHWHSTRSSCPSRLLSAWLWVRRLLRFSKCWSTNPSCGSGSVWCCLLYTSRCV